MADKQRVALVTGAAQGIGRSIAHELARRGYIVAVNDLEAPAGTITEIESLGSKAISLPGDVSDEPRVGG